MTRNHQRASREAVEKLAHRARHLAAEGIVTAMVARDAGLSASTVSKMFHDTDATQIVYVAVEGAIKRLEKQLRDGQRQGPEVVPIAATAPTRDGFVATPIMESLRLSAPTLEEALAYVKSLPPDVYRDLTDFLAWQREKV
jgi:hypothetical protein